MPLVRYEIRNEHSLANPQLYRTAAKDDPEGLLEGVAMAGLVGIVRQLGDLAEFAAEVFRDLHEEVMATASRGHDLFARVQQLEAEMPAVEKALLSETNQLRFAYTPGVEWHASIRNDQNHCTQGDLPRFIRSSYEECRGPPRLFLLDKFDVAGAGACLKRYTDPSFFRTEWASSELMKAERVQRDEKARREKKKGRRRRNVDGKESILAEQYQSTFSHELSRELSQRNQAHPRMGHHPHSEVSKDASSVLEDTNQNNNLNALSRHVADSQGLKQHITRTSNITPSSTQEIPDSSMDTPVPAASEDPISSPPKYQKSLSAVNIEEEMVTEWDESGPEVSQKDDLEAQEEVGATTVDDGGSEGEQFLDALTTMESEADSDSEPYLRHDKDADNMQDSPEGQPISHEDVKLPGIRTDEKISPFGKQCGTSTFLDPSRPEISPEPRVIINGQDVKGTSCFTTAMNARRLSSDSMSSISSRKAKQVQLLEEPRESFRSSSQPFRISKDEKGATESSDQGPLLPFNSGIKVSKMVAAFERGSLEQVLAEEIEKDPQAIILASPTAGSDADAVNRATVEPGNGGGSEGHSSESNSPSQLRASHEEVDSPSSQDTFPKSDGSRPRSIKVRRTSISSRTSLGSLDSPPDSPTFSAIQSPVSPVRTERNILLSPDRLGFSAETLSPGSPTSVPILALSPTSQEVRHPGFFSVERGHGQVVGEPLSRTSPSRLPFDVPSTPRSKSGTKIAPPSLTTNVVIDDCAASSAEDSSHLQSSVLTRSLDDPLPPLPLVMLPEFVTPVHNVLDDSGELHDMSGTAHGLVHTSTVKSELNNSPRSEGVGSWHDPILSTSDDDVSMASKLNDNGPHHDLSKVEERIPPKPTLLLTPCASRNDGTLIVSKGNQDPSSQSPLNHDLTPPVSSSVKHDKLSSTSTRSFETTSNFSRDDFPFITKAAHRRFPSLPLVEKSLQDVSQVASSDSSRSPLEPVTPLNATPGAQLSAKFALKAPSSSPMSRIVHDLPHPVRKAAHNRFPSFPSSEGSVSEVPSTSPKSLELPSTSATPSRHALDVQVSASKFLHDLPSQTLCNLPPPTPPSKSEPNFPLPPPPRVEALHDLPPPPPPPGSSPPLSAIKPSTGVDVQDELLEAIASHDKSTLKKVKTMQNPSLRKGDDRSHLLEQIRAQSFNLRHTVVEKVDPPLPRPMTNINVAAILEKANAIRQAFAGSDEDDEDNEDWSDV